MKIIDSKERVFCQWGSRALQQEARPALASAGALFDCSRLCLVMRRHWGTPNRKRESSPPGQLPPFRSCSLFSL